MFFFFLSYMVRLSSTQSMEKLQFQLPTNHPLPLAFYEYSQGLGIRKVPFELKYMVVYFRQQEHKVKLFSFSCVCKIFFKWNLDFSNFQRKRKLDREIEGKI